MAEMHDLSASLKLLADPTRLRLLRVLALEELNSGELASILGKGQPAISRHVALLREAGIVDERREGRYAFFALSEAAHEPSSTAAWVVERAAESPDDAGDLARLDDVRRTRRERELGDGADGARSFVPGRSWRAWARAVSFLVPHFGQAVDLGCGEGALSLEIAHFSARVTGVDYRPEQIRRARSRATKQRVENATFLHAELAATGLPDQSFDLVVLSQSLHHAEDPRAMLSEALRLLRAGGRLVVLDLLPHEETWVRERLGHRHLGFSVAEVGDALEGVGFNAVQAERMPARPGDSFKVLVAAASAPGRSV